MSEMQKNISQRKNMSLIIGLSGKSGVGKTTSADYLVSKHGFLKIGFADRLKELTQMLVPELTDNQIHGTGKDREVELLNDHSPREFLMAFGNMMRYFIPDYWVSSLRVPKGRDIVIHDVRFKNEVEWLKYMGAKVVRIERYKKYLPNQKELSDVSETSLDKYDSWDYVIPAFNNVEKQDLYSELDKMILKFKYEKT